MSLSIPSATPSTTSQLVKTANGEYTAASVAQDPTDAAKLGLRRETDGNYGTQSPTTSAAATISAGVQAALTTLTLGGG